MDAFYGMAVRMMRRVGRPMIKKEVSVEDRTPFDNLHGKELGPVSLQNLSDEFSYPW